MKKITHLLIVVTLILGFVPDATAQGPGVGWQYYRTIALSPVTPSAGFQLKITLSTATLGNPYASINTNGSDLRFYDNNDVNCNYWIETWNTSGNSVIWVKVASSGATSLRMYYGNASATAASNGSNTFDFFDDFLGSSLGANWSTITSGGTVSVSGGQVTMSCTSTPSGQSYISSAFAPASASFLLETKHREGSYNRNRFYATTALFGGSPTGFDYGYFSDASGSQTNAKIFWNGYPSSNSMSSNTNYLTQWRITDGSTYHWYTYNYGTGATITNGSRTTTVASTIRYITIGVTEVAGTSTIVDWVRVRKYAATEPAPTIGAQLTYNACGFSGNLNSNVIFTPCINMPSNQQTAATMSGGPVFCNERNSRACLYSENLLQSHSSKLVTVIGL
jgi:hypothetical protein